MVEVRQTRAFVDWLNDLKDQRALARILGPIARIEIGGLGDVKRFEGLTEFRIDYGPGYRLYATQRGDALVILLCGGDKGSQARDIIRAKKLLGELD